MVSWERQENVMLNQKIENLLKSNKKYISETKEILKTKVYEDAVNINK